MERGIGTENGECEWGMENGNNDGVMVLGRELDGERKWEQGIGTRKGDFKRGIGTRNANGKWEWEMERTGTGIGNWELELVRGNGNW